MTFSSEHEQNEKVVLDIGGEGRHPEAWNLNPSHVKTLGKNRGKPIPQHISGRADDIPLPDSSVDRIIVERTPLRVAALQEIARIIAPKGTIILRHVPLPNGDPHAFAKRILFGRISQRIIHLGGQVVQETAFTEIQGNEVPPHRSKSKGRSSVH
jgi:ubiquinone/menaquinone biosynthesis C-methylase UbiE